MANGRRNRSNLGVLLLGYQMMHLGIDKIPPVTLSTIVAQVLIYLRILDVPWNVGSACLSARKILWHKQYWPILWSAVEHGDDIHLYYNMASFMWKGRTLERQMGSKKFAVLLSVFTVCCSFMYVALAMAASHLDAPHYLDQCAVGFSGVIFALKVLTTHNSSGSTMIFPGVVLPMKWAVWGELLIIQMISPNASFIGHLAGIIVGLAYVLGPLKTIVNIISGVIPFGEVQSPRYFENRGYAGNRNRYGEQHNTAYSAFSGGMTEEEQVAEALRRSQQEGHGHNRYWQGGNQPAGQFGQGGNQPAGQFWNGASQPEQQFWQGWEQAEDSELQEAMRNSLNRDSRRGGSGPPNSFPSAPPDSPRARSPPYPTGPSEPPYPAHGGPGLYPTLPTEPPLPQYNADFIRQRRQQRFDSAYR